MENVYDIVLSFEKVSEHLKNNPGDKKKILKCIDEISGDYNKGYLTVMESFVDNTFVKLYDGINVELPDGFDLNQTLEKYHVVLCPNHQSHADYFALQYIFYKQFRIPVYIAAGINLNIFPIGIIFKKCGAFFIRRKFTDYLYKISFQGYIYYLLKTDKVVEFFFEGGRTRTGKLLPPKYGLFSMILDAHAKFDQDKKPLMFIPVSIAHEHIPEEGAHAKELGGAKKKKESTTQLLKVFKIFTKKLGTVHVKFGEGIVVDEEFDDLKLKTQDLAFETFRKVGKGMLITPSSLLSLILLDEPSGALTWKQIEKAAMEIINYCKAMNLPLTSSLRTDQAISSLRLAMDMFLNNKKVYLVKKAKLNLVYYAISEDARVHLLYHKNMILHHFFVPTIMSSVWINILNGSIKTKTSLTKFLIRKRKELKYEFYLPRNEEMIEEGVRIIEYSIGRKIENVGDVLELSQEELFQIAKKVKRYATAFNHIYEAYYIALVSVKYLHAEPFNWDKFLQTAQEIFTMEIEHGRIVQYPESFAVPKMKSSLDYLLNQNVIGMEEGKFFIDDLDKLNQALEKFIKDINDQVAINFKLSDYD
ncbi:MAG: hypothetical protein CME62_09780 [Halobacteriovoraceae bacterium]|nr:hypothetical protein [Halobacteriovoraceae bacterium]